jgi:L-cystine transport system permease protein
MGKIYDFNLVIQYLPQLLSCLHITLLIVILATVLGTILGTLIAMIRLFKMPVLSQLSVVYISFMRGTPILVQMFVIYYGLPAVLLIIGININQWDKLIYVILTYGMNMAAFMAEIIRAAITSVPAGQSEAAYSVGLTRMQTFFRIVAPQAVITALPSISINMVGLLQDSSIAFSIGIIDVMGKAQTIGASSYHSLEAYTGAAIIFLILSTVLENGFSLIERRMQVSIKGVSR